MLSLIKSDPIISNYITSEYLENDTGIIVDSQIPNDFYTAINIDEYYHKNSNPTPAIADLLFVLKLNTGSSKYNIYIIEMKNICSPRYFKVSNIYEKFKTAVDDFMKIRFNNIFTNADHDYENIKLYFISDAYKLLKKGFSEKQIQSFLNETKISTLQSLPPLQFQNHVLHIEYKLPNPIISWN